jgi:hypothetical protein
MVLKKGGWGENTKNRGFGDLRTDICPHTVLHIDRQTFLMYPKMPNRKQDTSCGHGDDATRCERSQPFSGTIRVPQSRLRHLDHDVHLVHIAVGTLKKKETYLKCYGRLYVILRVVIALWLVRY